MNETIRSLATTYRILFLGTTIYVRYTKHRLSDNVPVLTRLSMYETLYNFFGACSYKIITSSLMCNVLPYQRDSTQAVVVVVVLFVSGSCLGFSIYNR